MALKGVPEDQDHDHDHDRLIDSELLNDAAGTMCSWLANDPLLDTVGFRRLSIVLAALMGD